MPALNILNAFGLHALGPLAVTVLLFQIYRKYTRSYLLQWTRSFTCLTIFQLASATNIVLTEGGHPSRSLQIIVAIIGGAAAYLQVGWLVWGCAELAKQKPVRIRDSQRLLGVLAAIGVLSGTIPFLLPNDPAIHRFFYLGLHALAVGGTFSLSGIAIRRFRGAGFTLPAIAFVAYGLVQFEEFILIISSLLARDIPMPLTWIAIADLVGSAVISLGMVLAVLEDERETSVQAASQVEHLAYHDTLTGLANRALFSDRLMVALTHAQRHRYKMAVLFLDIDRFKQINDSLGHTVGDRLLRTVATRIRSTIREEDTVARFGGDEFTVLIHIIGKIEDAGKVAQKILESLKIPIVIDDREFVTTSSIGISVFPVDGTDSETLIRNADTAMYRAKDLGRNMYQFYASNMNHKALEALELENGLRRALSNDELVLYYQPLVDVVSGDIFGMEALVRWKHPQLGLLNPDRFIPAAEQSGLIVPIGKWVLREACRQAKEWQRRGRSLLVAVNLSARQFQEPDLARQVKEALEQAELRPEFLELEITEGNAMQDVEKAIQTLRQLKSLGIRIALDDFGTGYSCLNYLKQFPIDTLKLDQSFVRDITAPEDSQIALGVIALAHSLRLKVVAEGVETIGQLTFLRENACDRLQGYLFSRPMPAEHFERFAGQKDSMNISAFRTNSVRAV